MTTPQHHRTPPPASISGPSTARQYDAHQDGKSAYEADRDVVRRLRGLGLDTKLMATENRSFVLRAVDHTARDLGIDQVLDVGCGLPSDSGPNIHNIVEKVHPHGRILYVDHDPLVRAHADALLHSQTAKTAVVQADLRDPDAILTQARQFLTFTRPIALLLGAVAHFIRDEEQPHALVAHLLDALPPGSALVLSHATDDYAPQVMRRAEALLAEEQIHSRARSRADVERFLAGLTLVDPGLVPVHQWHQPDPDTAAITPSEVHGYGAVGIKQTPTHGGADIEQLSRHAQLSARQEGGVLIVTVIGTIEEQGHAPLRDRLTTLADESTTDMVLDLRGVEFLDSATVGAVLGLRVRLSDQERTLQLLGGEPVRKLLRIMGFTLPLHADLGQALAAAQRKQWRR
ncbi:SAM-dependent methyltransferase [Streptomyces sp. NPDC059076]|uniref:SAM-dependent methyltransferase n=1 Tax=unclassified Streptomyces TaxID=2593676 RepID=UPI0036CFAAF3